MAQNLEVSLTNMIIRINKNRNNPWFDDNIHNLIFNHDYYHQKAIYTKDSYHMDR